VKITTQTASVRVTSPPGGAWALMPPSCWSLWPQGGGNRCPCVSVAPSWPWPWWSFPRHPFMTCRVTWPPRRHAVSSYLVKIFLYIGLTGDATFFPGLSGVSLVFPSKLTFLSFGSTQPYTIRQNKTNLFFHSRINSAMQVTTKTRCSCGLQSEASRTKGQWLLS